MHVAYIHQHFSTPRGATGTRSYEMSRQLIDAGHRVTLVCGVYDSGDLGDKLTQRVNEFEVDGIRLNCIAEPYGNDMSFMRRLKAFGSFARTATRIVRRLDADLVVASSTPLSVGLPGMKGAKALGVPFVFEVRDLWPAIAQEIGVLKNPALIWWAHRLERRIYSAADRIIALAPGMKEGICQTGYPADRVTLIPNGCDLQLFRPSSDPLDDPRFGAPDDFRLVFTGAHGMANGLDAVLDAAVDLKRRGTHGVRLILIGRGRLKSQLMQRAHQEGLDDWVTFLDPMPKQQLAEILPRMDVGMMILRNLPGFYYGTSPNKFFDYLASGLPVLNNYPGWVADMIDEHKCGIAVPPDDPGALADAVIHLRDHIDDRAEMGRNARQLGVAKFDRLQLAAQFVRVLEQAYGQS